MSWHKVKNTGLDNIEISLTGKVRRKYKGKWKSVKTFLNNGSQRFLYTKESGSKSHMSVSKALYEALYGDVPKGMRVINKNGIPDDIRRDNIDIVDIHYRNDISKKEDINSVEKVIRHVKKYKKLAILCYTRTRLNLTRDEQVEILREIIPGIKVKKLHKTGYEVSHEGEEVLRIYDVVNVPYLEFFKKIVCDILFYIGYDDERVLFEFEGNRFKIVEREPSIEDRL